MTPRDQKRDAEAFVAHWTAQRGSEKGKRVNSIDYVGAWYYKAAALMVSRLFEMYAKLPASL